MGKGEMARKREISPLPIVFSTKLENCLPFLSNLKSLSANAFSFEESKICCLGKGYRKSIAKESLECISCIDMIYLSIDLDY